MKVVYVTAESYIDHGYTIIKELKKHIDMPVYLQAKGMTEEISRWCDKFNAEFVKRKRFRNLLSIFSETAFLLRLRKHKADLVWFNTLTVYQVFLVRLFLKNFLVIMHDVELHPETKDRHAQLSVKLTLKYFKHNICVVSKTQAELFRDIYGVEPPVFRLPVIDYYKDCAEGGSGLQPSGSAAGKPVRFFFFGSVEAYKGIEILIQACKILKETEGVPAFEVHICGKIKYSVNEIIREASGLSSVTIVNKFIDYRDIHYIYRAFDVLVLPYKQVTQCGPLLIGYSENVPSICSDLQGFREYVEDGNTGIIFDNTPEDLAGKMLEMIKDPGKITRLKEGIEHTALKKFSMQYLHSEYISNFKKACSGRDNTLQKPL